jgi:type I restriction-modification system DNA methylase subunit
MDKESMISPDWRSDTSETKDYRTDFQTPPDVCKYMASLIPAGSVTVLEPSPGIGNIVRELDDYKVTHPKDFFLLDKRIRFDCVVMNPPFSTKYALMENAPADFQHKGMRLGYYFLTECMKMSDHIIALMPWFTISDSDIRLRAIKDFGLKSITALPRRTFQYARIQTCVLEMEFRYRGTTEFKVYDRLKESIQIPISEFEREVANG